MQYSAIVRIHEETGKETLYLGRREWAYIPGLPLAESEALLDELWSYAALAQNVWQQTWQPNDLIVWDNRVDAARCISGVVKRFVSMA